VSQSSEILVVKRLGRSEDTGIVQIFQRSTINISNINTLKSIYCVHFQSIIKHGIIFVG